MGIPGSANLMMLGGGAQAYQLEQSLRFNSGDNTVLTRNLTTQGNRTTWTFGGWFKRAETGVTHHLWTAAPGAHASTPYITYLELTDADKLMAYSIDNNVEKFRLRTNQLFRDASAWYHIVMVVDTTLATANDRVKLYVNGEQITSFEQRTNPSQNYETNVNNTIDHTLGEEATRDRYNYNGYMAEVHFVDGTALDATSFGEYDDNGVWRPIEYTGSHGTQGFYLKFDPSATNGIGHDHSGNGNNFTASGFTTSGTGTDVMSDTPTTNWCTWNPLDKNASTSLSDGNLYLTPSASSSSRATFGVSSGLWYYECTVGSVSTNTIIFGYADSLHPTNTYPGTNTTGFGVSYYGYNGVVALNNSSAATLSAATQGDIIGVAVDLTNDKIWFSKNGTWMGTGTQDPNTNQGGISISSRGTSTIFPVGGSGTPAAGASYFNFGQRELAYPSGTSSATEYFNTVTYTGTGSAQSITGVGFQPDLVWVKRRDSSANSHALFDVARGAGERISSNEDSQEVDNTSYFTSFNSDGFSVALDGGETNLSGATYVAWCWKAGGTASSNTDGDITASVSANQAAGFSVVKYTGTGASNATVGHGLGATPSLVISKVLSGTTGPWYVKHKDLSSGYNIYLNWNYAQTALTSGGGIGDLSSSTTFTCANGSSNNGNTNSSGYNYITYCFAEKENVSKFGSYTGNGSSNGPDVYCGFKPALVIIKNTSSTGSWYMADTARSSSNPVNDLLFADQSNSEYVNDANGIDVTNNGFKIRNTGSTYNSSGSTYIFMAFAQNFSVDESFKALNTANLPAPDIADGSKYFDTTLYTGNGTTITVTNSGGFTPDMVWHKGRSVAYWHSIVDVVRGNSNVLFTNTTDAEANPGAQLDITTGGFISTYRSANLANNQSSATYVGWQWKAGGSGSSNTAGSITSTVSANPSAGFSIVSYTGDGNTSSSVTIGHGLGVAPDFIITKMRSSGTDYGWSCWHKDLGGNYGIWLDKTSARNVSMWDGYSSFSDTVFTPPDKDYGNVSGKEYINYCFAEVEGYSKFGSYTGNGSSDGPFVHCGFKPAWVLFKRSDTTSNWLLYDNARLGYNQSNNYLLPDLANSEGSGDNFIDILSNGFKVRVGSQSINVSGGTYIFAAFAEHPTGGSGVSPATAR